MSLQTIEREFEGYLEDRKSRFLAYLVPLAVFEDRLEALRSEHRKANHFVTAHRHILDDDRIEESGKDDGEPAGTSGMPTLRVLQGARLVEAGVIVVRYFGGVKLGGGGLARAYSGAAADAIAHADLIAFVRHAQRTVEATFTASSDLERRISDLGLTVITRDYTADGVRLLVEGPEDKVVQL
ncbi:YigZ family protein [Roseibium litorale]|uniref:YigZ family protein n=1 Tax=Roseibium litorale TaxID=2803841 RepID=A0ABR9CRA7_9HYPH|nr:YigZ family protein [Roseibium litorale]MBD8893154.1 YigZ family protein [Roseibium litorale]